MSYRRWWWEKSQRGKEEVRGLKGGLIKIPGNRRKRFSSVLHRITPWTFSHFCHFVSMILMQPFYCGSGYICMIILLLEVNLNNLKSFFPSSDRFIKVHPSFSSISPLTALKQFFLKTNPTAWYFHHHTYPGTVCLEECFSFWLLQSFLPELFGVIECHDAVFFSNVL